MVRFWLKDQDLRGPSAQTKSGWGDCQVRPPVGPQALGELGDLDKQQAWERWKRSAVDQCKRLAETLEAEKAEQRRKELGLPKEKPNPPPLPGLVQERSTAQPASTPHVKSHWETVIEAPKLARPPSAPREKIVRAVDTCRVIRGPGRHTSSGWGDLWEQRGPWLGACGPLNLSFGSGAQRTDLQADPLADPNKVYAKVPGGLANIKPEAFQGTVSTTVPDDSRTPSPTRGSPSP